MAAERLPIVEAMRRKLTADRWEAKSLSMVRLSLKIIRRRFPAGAA